ncbi:recombinase family protein [Thalassospira xiamenensis]|uniref:recombinase family protein n=1 Tax=Thalassospira xiamenensis TaxID=220697 RepID=UPI003AA8A1CC
MTTDTGGQLYGYDLVHALDEFGEPIRGKRKINEEQAEIVREIFEYYAEGRKLKHICDDLNRRGIDSPKGGKWAPSSLVGSFVRQTGMLRQTLYNGVVTFNKMQYRKHPENGKRLSIMRPEKEWITVPIPELTMIDDATFAKVQKALDERSSKHLQRKMMPALMTEEEKRETSIRRSKEWRRKQAVTKKRANALFGGKLYCGEHNQKITATYAKHYSCPVKGCANRNLHYDEIIKLVLDAVAELDEAKIIEHFESEEIQQVRAHHAREIERLTQHLEDLRASINKVIDALGSDARSTEIRAFFDDKAEQIQRRKLDIAHHKRELAGSTPPRKLENIIQRHQNLVANLRAWSRDPEAVACMRQIIDRLTLDTASQKTGKAMCTVDFDLQSIISTNKRP